MSSLNVWLSPKDICFLAAVHREIHQLKTEGFAESEIELEALRRVISRGPCEKEKESSAQHALLPLPVSQLRLLWAAGFCRQEDGSPLVAEDGHLLCERLYFHRTFGTGRKVEIPQKNTDHLNLNPENSESPATFPHLQFNDPPTFEDEIDEIARLKAELKTKNTSERVKSSGHFQRFLLNTVFTDAQSLQRSIDAKTEEIYRRGRSYAKEVVSQISDKMLSAFDKLLVPHFDKLKEMKGKELEYLKMLEINVEAAKNGKRYLSINDALKTLDVIHEGVEPYNGSMAKSKDVISHNLGILQKSSIVEDITSGMTSLKSCEKRVADSTKIRRVRDS